MNTFQLSKLLFNKAEATFLPSDSFSGGVAISLLQDSEEMLAWAIVKARNISIKPKEGFVSILESIEKSGVPVHFKAQALQLNNARVNFKHYGNLPLNSDVPNFISDCKSFLIENSKTLNVDFESISLFDSINDEKLRALLKESEAYLSEENIEEALIFTSRAFDRLEKIVVDFLDVDTWLRSDIEDAYRLWPDEKSDAALDFTRLLHKQFENIYRHLAYGQFGYSPEYVESIKQMCLSVAVSQSGKILGISQRRNSTLTRENVVLINHFISESSRKLKL